MSTPSAKSTKFTAAHLERAVHLAGEYARQIAQSFPDLNRRELMKVLREFQRGLFPAGKRGRHRTERISAAYRDWLNGMRGVQLYRKYIPNYDRLDHWERRGRARALDQAIRARHRQELKEAKKIEVN